MKKRIFCTKQGHTCTSMSPIPQYSAKMVTQAPPSMIMSPSRREAGLRPGTLFPHCLQHSPIYHPGQPSEAQLISGCDPEPHSTQKAKGKGIQEGFRWDVDRLEGIRIPPDCTSMPLGFIRGTGFSVGGSHSEEKPL